MILVDTSVWVAHFRQHNAHLAGLLTTAQVLCHPHVIVEIACGTPPDRRAMLGLLSALPQAPVATHAELLTLIERRALFARGCGYVDLNLLASVLLRPSTRLWTLDRRLAAIATEWDRSHVPVT